MVRPAQIKKKRKFSPYIRKFRGIVQSHIWLTTSSYMVKIFMHFLRKPFLIYDFAPDPIWISLYMRKIFFPFYQCESKDIYSEKTSVYPAIPPFFTTHQIPRWVLTTEYTQSSNVQFLATIPSW
jgi:hypothetical protein